MESPTMEPKATILNDVTPLLSKWDDFSLCEYRENSQCQNEIYNGDYDGLISYINGNPNIGHKKVRMLSFNDEQNMVVCIDLNNKEEI